MTCDGLLPVPRPLETAVEAGVFGWEESGPCEPTEEHVRALTEEHVRQTCGVLSDLAWLQRCAAQGLDPQTGARPRGTTGRERMERISDEVKRNQQAYDDLLAVYEQAFGETAAMGLDHYARAWLRREPGDQQRLLF